MRPHAYLWGGVGVGIVSSTSAFFSSFEVAICYLPSVPQDGVGVLLSSSAILANHWPAFREVPFCLRDILSQLSFSAPHLCYVVSVHSWEICGDWMHICFITESLGFSFIMSVHKWALKGCQQSGWFPLSHIYGEVSSSFWHVPREGNSHEILLSYEEPIPFKRLLDFHPWVVYKF